MNFSFDTFLVAIYDLPFLFAKVRIYFQYAYELMQVMFRKIIRGLEQN